MEKLYDSINRKKKFFWSATLIYIVFNSCCLFPLNIRTKTIDNSFLLTLFFTAIGMGLRYILEFGEVSNTVNFTDINILVFLIAIPLFVMLAYLIIPKLKFD